VILSAKQPYFLPHLAYYQVISAVDKYIIYSNINFIRHGWISRNRILMLNKGPSFFIVPLLHQSCNRKINEIRIDQSYNWQRKILKSVSWNYRKAPYFDETFPLIESVINHETDLIWELAAESTIRIASYLDIKTEIQTDNSPYAELDLKLESNNYRDEEIFRNLGIHGYEKKVIRIIYIALTEKADIFIDSIGGRELYDPCIFRKHGIDFRFLNMNPVSYKQLSADFYPSLSIIDTLMNCGKEKTKELLKEYTLV